MVQICWICEGRISIGQMQHLAPRSRGQHSTTIPPLSASPLSALSLPTSHTTMCLHINYVFARCLHSDMVAYSQRCSAALEYEHLLPFPGIGLPARCRRPW